MRLASAVCIVSLCSFIIACEEEVKEPKLYELPRRNVNANLQSQFPKNFNLNNPALAGFDNPNAALRTIANGAPPQNFTVSQNPWSYLPPPSNSPDNPISMQQRFGNPYSDYVPPEMGGRNIPRSQNVNQGSVQQLPQFGQGQGQMSPMQQMPQGQIQMPMQMQNMGMMQPPPQMMGGMGMMPPGGGSQMQPRGMLPPVEPVPDYSQEEFDPNSFQPPDFSSPEFSSEQNSPQSYAPMPPQMGGPYGQPDMMQMPSSMAQGGSYSSDDPYSIVGLPESYPPTNNPGFADSMPARNFVPQPSEYAPMPSTEQISNAIETEMQSGAGGFRQMGGVSQQGNNQGYGSLIGQGFQPMNNNYPSSMPASMRGGSSVSSSSQNSGGFPPPPPMEPFPIPR